MSNTQEHEGGLIVFRAHSDSQCASRRLDLDVRASICASEGEVIVEGEIYLLDLEEGELWFDRVGRSAMALSAIGKVRWRKRIVTGTSSFGPGLLLVDKLAGIQLQCPKCGSRKCAVYRHPESRSSAGGYYLKCNACNRKTHMSERVFGALVREALPANYMDVLE